MRKIETRKLRRKLPEEASQIVAPSELEQLTDGEVNDFAKRMLKIKRGIGYQACRGVLAPVLSNMSTAKSG
jgi:hypothetical protein